MAAIRGWTLLLSTVPAFELDSSFVETHLSLLHGGHGLHSADVDVRGAAGEAVALLYGNCSLTSLPESPRPPRSTVKPGPFSTPLPGSSDGRPPLPRRGRSSSPASGTPVQKQLDVTAQAAGSPSIRHPGSNQTGAAGDAGDAAEQGAPPSSCSSPLYEQSTKTAGTAGLTGQGDATAAAQAPQQLEQQPATNGGRQHAEEEAGPSEPLSPVGHGLAPLQLQQVRNGSSATGEEANGSGAGVAVERLEDIVSRMRDLAKNRGDSQRKSKADRRELRSTFRGLVDIVEDGSVAAQKVKLRHGDVLVVDTLPGVIRLNFFRRLLAEGFQAHLQHNPLLHQVGTLRGLGVQMPAQHCGWPEGRWHGGSVDAPCWCCRPRPSCRYSTSSRAGSPRSGCQPWRSGSSSHSQVPRARHGRRRGREKGS